MKGVFQHFYKLSKRGRSIFIILFSLKTFCQSASCIQTYDIFIVYNLYSGSQPHDGLRASLVISVHGHLDSFFICIATYEVGI